jgi:CRP-like cAMP-binding protein
VNKMLKMNHRDREILLSTPLMAGLDPALAKRVLDIPVVFGAEARDVLIHEGHAAENFYTVLSGYVRLYRQSRDGKEADIGVYGPGDTFGECAMFLGTQYLFNAQAAEPATLARFDVVRVREIMTQEPEFTMALMGVMAHHLQDARDNVANDRLHTAPQRVANYLLEMLQRSENQDANSFRLPFQKSLLAGKLGLAPEALSRAFSALRSSGVSIRGRMIQITDEEALRRI